MPGAQKPPIHISGQIFVMGPLFLSSIVAVPSCQVAENRVSMAVSDSIYCGNCDRAIGGINDTIRFSINQPAIPDRSRQ